MNAVAIDSVTKTFGEVKAVDDLTLAVPEGSIYGFIGPNGSGKTTTMRMIVNIFEPDAGTIRLFGQPRAEAPIGTVGYLPEERGLYRNMEVKALLEFYGELRSGRKVSAEVDYWLERLGLAAWGGHKLQALSKGMTQRVQFIAAIVPSPKLLVLDEPFSGLDPVSAEVLRESILELRRRKATIILSTHDMQVAETMCDSIFMIFRGKKVLDGTLASIQERYGSDTLRVEASGGAAALTGLSGVESVRDLGQVQELRLARGSDSQDVLRELLAATRVASFSVAKPSLHDIFIRIAGPSAAEAEVQEEKAEASHA
jgi:ABC-2 type transport system ATP-binding protein